MLFIIGGTSIGTPSFAQSYGSETVIGSVSGSLDAGDAFELYKYSADNLRDYLAGWKDVGWKDNRITYSSNEIYNKCLEKAKRQYGRNYPNLYLKDFNFDVNEERAEDQEYYSQAVGSSTQFIKKERVKRVYYYSATVVVSE